MKVIFNMDSDETFSYWQLIVSIAKAVGFFYEK